MRALWSPLRLARVLAWRRWLAPCCAASVGLGASGQVDRRARLAAQHGAQVGSGAGHSSGPAPHPLPPHRTPATSTSTTSQRYVDGAGTDTRTAAELNPLYGLLDASASRNVWVGSRSSP
ncbi:hypothetical protein [Mycobacterium sp. URHB0021]